MKRLVILLALLLFTACSNQSEPEHTQATKQTTSTKEENTMTTIFTGKITSSYTAESDPSVLSIVLHSVEAINDPDAIVSAFKNDGVIVHVPVDTLEEVPPEQLSEGSIVQCTLKEVPIMTMSIPPQLPGNSIEKIELISSGE